MYYNINEQLLLRKLPKNLLKSDGGLLINFDQQNIDTLADYGFYTIRNDNSDPPTSNSIEDKNAQQIILDKPYADIVRVWIDAVVPTNMVEPPASKE